MKETKPSWSLFGEALFSYWKGDKSASITILMEGDEPDEQSVKLFFRHKSEMPELELTALELCQGKILDVGAGSGCHSLLIHKEKEVHPVDISPKAVEVMKERGLQNAFQSSFLDLNPNEHSYDTILCLMNGVGVSANLAGLAAFLKQAYALTKSNGQLLVDSSDLRNTVMELENTSGYFGEAMFRISYNNVDGDWYSWLYVDPDTLEKTANEIGWSMEIVAWEEDDTYLARLTKT